MANDQESIYEIKNLVSAKLVITRSERSPKVETSVRCTTDLENVKKCIDTVEQVTSELLKRASAKP